MYWTSWLYGVMTIALVLLGSHRVNSVLIHNVSLGTGPEQGLVLAQMDSGDAGILCFLRSSNLGDAVCAVLQGRPKATKAVASIFNGTTSRKVVGAIDGCPDFKPDQSGRWNLNNDCRVITGPTIPSDCQSRRLAVDCSPLVLLRHGPGPNEGLVMAGLNDTLGTVCASGVGVNEAVAVCRSLGFPNPERGIPLIGRYKPNVTNPEENVTSIEDLRCSPGAASLAACTWRPATSPNCFREGNRLAVSCPSNPVTPKPMPSPSLLCYRQQASVCFQAPSLSGPSDLTLMLNASHPSACTVDSQTNGTHVCMRVFNYSACTEVWADQSDRTEYHLIVRFNGEFDASGNYIRPPLTFNLFCVVSKESLATGASVAPEFATPTSARDGHGGGDAAVELYRDLINGHLSNPVLGSVQVGTVLYAGVVLRSSEPDAWLVVNNCWAIDGVQNVSLVSNKCPARADVALIPINATVIAVRFQAFLFNTSGSSGSISLVCSTVACRYGDPSEECNRICGAFRGGGAGAKRISESSNREHYLTRPALLSVHTGDGGVGKSADSSNFASFWQRLPVVAGATLLLIVALKTFC